MKTLFLVIGLSTLFTTFTQTIPQLRSADCYRTNMPINQMPYANPTGGIQYKFKVKNLVTGITDSLISADRAFSINELPSVARYNCNYQVNVKIDMGSGFGSWGNICTVSIAPLISNLRSVDCPKNLLTLNSPVYSNINPIPYPNTDYWDFEVRRADDFSVSEQVLNRPNHEFNLSMTSNPLFQSSGTTYQVRVRTSQQGLLQPWGGWCSITTPVGGPQITWGCGVTLEYLSYQTITCTNMPGATQYEFMLRSGPNLLGTKLTSVNNIKLDVFVNSSGIPLYNYGSTYRITSRALINGIWTGWGSLCYIHTTAQPHAEVMNQCGGTLAAFTTPISFYAVAHSYYEFELTDLTPGIYNDGVQTVTQLSRQIRLNQFAQWSWGHQYSIRCRLKFKGITYAYSTACVINAPKTTCGLRGPDCPKTLTSTGQAVYSIIMTQDNPVNVTAYQYKIGTNISAWKYGTAGRQITLQEILGTTPSFNTTYQIQVRVMHEGIAQEWGWTCSVTTPNAIITDSTNIYPNPFTNTFKISNITVDKIQIMDLSGKVIETIIEPTGDLGGNLPTGAYYMIIEDKVYKIFKN